MNKRLEQFMKEEGLTSAKFAEILSVQPSSISHLLSGRNNPSFDFISKLLLMFPRLNPHWIINGHGDIYLDDRIGLKMEKSTEPPKFVIADIFSQNSETNSSQEADIQSNQSVNSVNADTNSFGQHFSDVTSPQIDVVADSPTIKNIPDINNSNSANNIQAQPSLKRNVERVLLLYNDNSFEFFNR